MLFFFLENKQYMFHQMVYYDTCIQDKAIYTHKKFPVVLFFLVFVLFLLVLVLFFFVFVLFFLVLWEK